jgi:hypothetical protein
MTVDPSWPATSRGATPPRPLISRLLRVNKAGRVLGDERAGQMPVLVVLAGSRMTHHTHHSVIRIIVGLTWMSCPVLRQSNT